jgi:glutamine amidotransferase PdxT
MILLSNHAIKKAESGQSLVGGLDVYVCRNYFGSQVCKIIFCKILSEVMNPVDSDSQLCD